MNWNELIFFASTSLFTAFLGWFFGRKRTKAETESIEIKNIRDVNESQAEYIKRQDEIILKQAATIERQNERIQALEAKVNEHTQTLFNLTNELKK